MPHYLPYFILPFGLAFSVLSAENVADAVFRAALVLLAALAAIGSNP